MKINHVTIKPDNQKPMKSAYVVYCRKSSESDDRQAASIKEQVSILKQFATDKGLSVVKRFSESKSAKAPLVRKEFQAMIEFVTTRKDVKGIITWKLNRLSRNPVDTGTLQWLLQTGVIEEIVTPSKTYTEADSDFIMAVEGAQANRFIRDLREDTLRGIQAKIEQGIAPVLAPLGYKNNTAKPQGQRDIELSDTWPLVRKLFDLALTGQYSVMDLVGKATSMGLRNSRGNSISKTAMYETVKNPFYTGKFLYKGNLYQGVHKPLLTQAEFDLIQEIYGFASRARPEKHEFTFNNLIRCECGGWYCAEQHIKYYKNGTQQRFVYYRCSRRISGCPRFYVKEENLQTQVGAFLGLLTIKKHYIDWFIKWLGKKNEDKVVVRDAQRKQLEKALQNVNMRIDRLLQLKLSEGNVNGSMVSDEEYQTAREKFLKEREEVKEGLDNADKHFDQVDDLLVKTFSFAAKAKEVMAGKDIRKKKILLHAIGANLTIKNKEIDITPRYPFERIKQEFAGVIACEPEESLSQRPNLQKSINWGTSFVLNL